MVLVLLGVIRHGGLETFTRCHDKKLLDRLHYLEPNLRSERASPLIQLTKSQGLHLGAWEHSLTCLHDGLLCSSIALFLTTHDVSCSGAWYGALIQTPLLVDDLGEEMVHLVKNIVQAALLLLDLLQGTIR